MQSTYSAQSNVHLQPNKLQSKSNQTNYNNANMVELNQNHSKTDKLIKYMSIWRPKSNLTLAIFGSIGGWEVFVDKLVNKSDSKGKEYRNQAKRLLSNSSEMIIDQPILLSSDTEEELIHALPHMLERGRRESMVVFIVVTSLEFNHIYLSEELLNDFRDRFLIFDKLCMHKNRKGSKIQHIPKRKNIFQTLLDKYGYKPEQNENIEIPALHTCTVDCNHTTAIVDAYSQLEACEIEENSQKNSTQSESEKENQIEDILGIDSFLPSTPPPAKVDIQENRNSFSWIQEETPKETSLEDFFLNEEEQREPQLADFFQQQSTQSPQTQYDQDQHQKYHRQQRRQ